MLEVPDLAQWAFRLLLGAVSATLTAHVTLRGVDFLATESPSVHATALKILDQTLTDASKSSREALDVVFFGDSLSMSADFKFAGRSVAWLLEAKLEKADRTLETSTEAGVRVIPVLFSLLSQHSLYYMSDRIAELQPDLVVIEFNLYNFSSFWENRDRKILAAMLDLSRFPQLLALPTSPASQATDQWIYDRVLFRNGFLSEWEEVQRAQARALEALWILADRIQESVVSPKQNVRSLNRILELKENNQSANRATESYARKLLGRALTGVSRNHAALRMLDATLRRFREDGIRMLVFVPPYNVDHLGSLGVLEGARIEESIAQVRSVAEQGGAQFLDVHDLLPDHYFRDSMDHLTETKNANGHERLAQRLADFIAADAKHTVTGQR
jgi:hypothetical protein